MTDLFALLDLPRNPFLEPAAVKACFTELASPVHPDRVHQFDESTRRTATERYAELNEACRILSDTRLRLKHLIELETGESPSDIGSVPAHISDLFFKVGQVFAQADRVIGLRDDKAPAMVRAGWMTRAMEQTESLRALQRELKAHLDSLDDRTRQRGRSWTHADDSSVNELARLYRDYSYLNKWMNQVQEKQLQLMP